jgi:hypothetical protein
MGTDNADDDRRAEESAVPDVEEPTVTPDAAPPNTPEGDDCTDPGPGRDPRPDLRGA